MKISELITELQKELEKNGDAEVVVNGHDFTTNAIYLDYIGWFYDGGVILKDPNFDGKFHCNKWLKSKKHPELGQRYLHIMCDEPCLVDGNEYIEGVLIPEIPASSCEELEDFDEKYNLNKKIFREA